MKKAEYIEGNKLYLKNNCFEYDKENKVYYRTYGNNSKPVYVFEYQLDMPYRKFDALVEKIRLDALKFRNITSSDLNRIAKEGKEGREGEL